MLFRSRIITVQNRDFGLGRERPRIGQADFKISANRQLARPAVKAIAKSPSPLLCLLAAFAKIRSIANWRMRSPSLRRLHLNCKSSIGQLPLYNQDFDQNTPQPYLDFRGRVRAADGVLFVTPEHNRSMPAALKNALDVASRPYGQSAWNGKPGAVISASPGTVGGFGASHHLRQSLVFLNVPVMQQPEA